MGDLVADNADTQTVRDAAEALRARRDIIVRCAVAFDASIASEGAGSAAEIVEKLAHLLETEESVTTAETLPAAPETDHVSEARRVRIVEAFCIEAIRHALPEAESKDAIILLREHARNHIPQPPVDPEQFRFFEQFMESPEAAAPGEQARTNAFMHLVMNGLDEMVYAHDVHGTMLFVNKRCMAVTGFTRDDLYDGLSMYDFVAPESLDLIENRLQSPDHAPWSRAQINVLSKDGRRVAIEFHTRPYIIDGRLEAIVGMGRPINCLQTIGIQPGARPVGIVFLNADGCVIDTNPEVGKVIGAPVVADIVGKRFTDLLGHSPAVDALRDQIGSRQTFSADVRGKSMYGFPFDLRIHAKVTQDQTTSVLTVESALGVQADGMAPSGEMLASIMTIAKGVAHELNNPLTGIWGHAQRLLQGATDETQRQRLDQIVQEAGRCRRVMEGLLGFAEARNAEFSPIDPKTVVTTPVHLMRYQIESEGIALNVNLPESLPKILGNAEALTAVVRHLVHNAHLAARDTPESRERRVDVSAAQEGKHLLIEVSDSGPGVPAETRKHIFTPFYTSRPLGEGIGIGLSICFGIVNEHGGTITVRDNKGGGAQFAVRLPVHES